MKGTALRRHSVLLLFAIAFVSRPLYGEGQPAPQPRPSTTKQVPGYQGLFIAGFNLPSPADSFAASGLKERPFEFGGGVQATNVWRAMFVQASATRWQQTGERTFIDSNGTQYPLGIPLDVRATFVDFSGGWRFEKSGAKAPRITPFGGGGMGLVLYRETSPFATEGDDLDEHFTSYHVFGGLEVGLTRWAAIAADVRYRFVPGILGEAGTSSVIGDDVFHGGSVSVRFVAGTRGHSVARSEPRTAPGDRTPDRPPPSRTQAPVKPAEPDDHTPPSKTTIGADRKDATVNISSGIFVVPDATRTPLRVLEAGTRIKVLEATEEWLKVEFRDPQWGPRVGYVLRRNCTY